MWGWSLRLIGVRRTRIIAFPLAYLLTSIPLPVFLYASLSSQLQLWSSALGVGVLQLVGVTAFRDGNVIDLGPVQLQVVEACSGIRYLLPLTSLALLCAYLFKDRMWKRVLLVLSSIPISIVVNGFRIGMIGVLVEWYGQGAAEGFYHLFEGWVLFMTSLGLLILEMWLLASIGTMGNRSPFLSRFTWADSICLATAPGEVSGPSLISEHSNLQPQAFQIPHPAYLCSVALLVPVAFASTLMVEREEVPPPRAIFVDFPMKLNGWLGTSLSLEKQYIDALRFDDYVLADFRFGDGQPVNLICRLLSVPKKGSISALSPKLPSRRWLGNLLVQAHGLAGELRDGSAAACQSSVDPEGQSEANRLVLVQAA